MRLRPEGSTDFAIDGGGTIWHANDREDAGAPFGTLDTEPRTPLPLGEMRGPTHLAVHPGGTVIGAWLNEDGETVVGWGEGLSFQPMGRPIPGRINDLRVSDGEVWVEQAGRILNADWGDRSWRDLGIAPASTGHIDVDSNGSPHSLEALPPVGPAGRQRMTLANYGQDGWEQVEIDLDDGLTIMPSEQSIGGDGALRQGLPRSDAPGVGPFRLGPEGAWFELAGPTDADGVHSCAGLAHLIGDEIDRYLLGECIGAIEVVADGSVWVQVLGEDSPIYVIRP